ncbi:MAG TPA: PIN domain-containing protein [Anaerovoracaceae bacterium]|nr:PIN domain-containing protein [Anaerovoracaceae bacterium]
MTLSEVPQIPFGEKVIFDTNIFIYSALGHQRYGNYCTHLIYEVESGEIAGYIPTIVLNELLHRLMIAEVIKKGFARHTKDAINALKHDSSIIPSLDICWEELNRIYEMHFTILEEKPDTFAKSIPISRRYSLLAKDAYIASFAKSYGITNIATNDRDFEHVEWLNVWRP